MHLIFFSVEFEDLWKFHAPVNIVQGFDVSLFDELIEVRIFLGYHLVWKVLFISDVAQKEFKRVRLSSHSPFAHAQERLFSWANVRSGGGGGGGWRTNAKTKLKEQGV